MNPVDIYRKFYRTADRIYQQNTPGTDAWAEHKDHLKKADTLLFLELPAKAAVEFKLALSALHQPAQ